MNTHDTVETLLNRFFPSNLLPWFDDASSFWLTLALGFDSQIEQTVSSWELDGFDDYPIWLSPDNRATLAFDRSTGWLMLSVHPTRDHRERHLAFLLWSATRSS